jgi:hypothetical protein
MREDGHPKTKSDKLDGLSLRLVDGQDKGKTDGELSTTEFEGEIGDVGWGQGDARDEHGFTVMIPTD